MCRLRVTSGRAAIPDILHGCPCAPLHMYDSMNTSKEGKCSDGTLWPLRDPAQQLCPIRAYARRLNETRLNDMVDEHHEDFSVRG